MIQWNYSGAEKPPFSLLEISLPMLSCSSIAADGMSQTPE
jgi:hypothetical protein